jgi:hypothetical protein
MYICKKKERKTPSPSPLSIKQGKSRIKAIAITHNTELEE